MLFEIPFNLGPYLVDSMGRISPAAGKAPSGFTFRWRERSLHARLKAEGENHMIVALTARLGRVPSTATTPEDATVRPRTLAVVRALPRSLPEGWRVRLMPDHQFRLEVQTEMQMPTTATALVTELTSFVLRLDPYLDVLDEVGILPGRC